MIKGRLTKFYKGECITEFICDKCDINVITSEKDFTKGQTILKKLGWEFDKDGSIYCNRCK